MSFCLLAHLKSLHRIILHILTVSVAWSSDDHAILYVLLVSWITGWLVTPPSSKCTHPLQAVSPVQASPVADMGVHCH